MWKDIPIPANMQGLPKDPRGFPVPYIVMWKDGVPHFKINDETITERCIEQQLCSVCGVVIPDDDMWFVGGQLSAFHPHGAFNDAPMHKECLVYALQVCPYMAYTQYLRKPLDLAKITTEQDIKDQMMYVDATQSEDRLLFFVICRTKGYSLHRYWPFRYFHPDKPYLEVEYWQDGNKISLAEAANLLIESKQKSWLPRTETKINS